MTLIEKKARIIVFNSAKGGVGKTTLIQNVSKYLSNKNKTVLIYELCPSGNMDKLLGVYSPTTQETIESRLQHSGSVNIEQTDDNTNFIGWGKSLVLNNQGDLTKSIIYKTVSLFDYILIDTPHILSVASITAMDIADEIYMVHDDNANAMHHFLERVELLTGDKDIYGLGYSFNKIKLVLNKNEQLDAKSFVDKGFQVYCVSYSDDYKNSSDYSDSCYIEEFKSTKVIQQISDISESILTNLSKGSIAPSSLGGGFY